MPQSSGSVNTESNHNLSEKLVCSSEVQVRDQGRLVSHQQDKLNEYEVFHNATSIPVPKPYTCVFTINHDEINMEIDTGCAMSLINQHTYKKLGAPALLPADTALSTFTGQSILVLGTISSNVGYKNQILKLPLLVVEGEGPNLCGRNWIELFNILPVSSCLSVSHENSIESLLNNDNDVFSSELGKFKDYQINLIVKPDVQPSFYKARYPTIAVRDKVKDELQRLQDVGIIKPVRYSQWAAPIVPVLKSDKTSIRICGDFKLTANIAIDPDQYPLPKADDIFASLAGGIQFSKLDLKNAYNQLELDEASRKFTVINTHLGLFEYVRLPLVCHLRQQSFKGVVSTYDPSKELVLACDASPYGVGAVLSHSINGEDRPIAFASRTLTPAEKNYAHIEKRP
ncbi:hypothetical protein JTE90_023235 [Oedothorax gibbosus]|uniref:Reverse transcriptase/retrotransposon-derived protein RNase H-like domain-containing protein n=1 Tax=Oedothorax gibbosus TaxID=931172 RepID=A0AAV6TP48_9ARAC|nr:hypothetical protein JTE90_023235 [Oedothorax gibbosus]